MASDRSLFPRLKALFQTDVVIRNSGAGQLRVVDPEQVFAFGNLQSNTLIDRFTRLHRSSMRQQFNTNTNYQTLRTQLYTDYEAMDTEGIISSALDVLAAEGTLKSEMGEVLSIRSSSDNIQSDLYNLFYNVLNIEFNLPIWIRSMCKYGDLFLKLDIIEKYGVFGAKPLSVYDVQREEGLDPDNPSYIRFIFDPIAMIGGTQSNRSKQTFENYEIAHFRYLMDTNFLPYGRSHLEPARKIWKQYVMIKDAMLLHRIMRAPEKRIFYMNVGNIPPAEVDAYMQKAVNNMKKTPFTDPNTGDYNLKFNVQNMLEDYYIPVRGNDTSTKIDTAKGLEYAGIDDVNFLLQELLSALKVPKAFLNYSDELNGKSTLAGLSLTFSKTVEHIQRIMISELKKIAEVHLTVLGYDDADAVNFELALTTPSILYEQEKIALLKEKVELATNMMEANIFSTDWIYDTIFNLSEDQLNEQRELIAEDVKRKFRWSQIENEGNDPVESGVSYGTPHDLASIYKNNASGNIGDTEVPDGYEDETNPVGRPTKHVSAYGTDRHYLGRDPLGAKGAKDSGKKDKSMKPKYKGGPLALEGLRSKYVPKKVVLYENAEIVSEITSSLLDENTLLNDE